MNDLAVRVTNIHLPSVSATGCALGYDAAGRIVEFVGDHVALREMDLALDRGEAVTVRVPISALTGISNVNGEEARAS